MFLRQLIKTLQIIWRYQEPKPPSWHHATPKQAIEQLEEFADAFNRFRKAADAISQDVYEPLWNWREDHGLEWTATNAPVHAIRLLDEQYPHLNRVQFETRSASLRRPPRGRRSGSGCWFAAMNRKATES